MKKILIMDDDFNNRRLLELYFKKYAEVSLAEDGEEGIKLIKNYILKGINFDLIILDLMMPNKNGFEVLEEIEKLKKTKKSIFNSKIIIYSILCDINTLNKIYNKYNVDAYLVKPIDSKEIKKFIHKFIAD